MKGAVWGTKGGPWALANSIELTSRDMDPHLSELERAFQLASSGLCSSVWDLKKRLVAEGYSGEQLFGPLLLRQLRERMALARSARGRHKLIARESRERASRKMRIPKR
jgi:hypothetical protein